jgi:hypothetical protein
VGRRDRSGGEKAERRGDNSWRAANTRIKSLRSGRGQTGQCSIVVLKAGSEKIQGKGGEGVGAEGRGDGKERGRQRR